MIELKSHPQGVILPVKAQPGARANALRGVRNGALVVAVTQVAEKGKANKAILEVLCDGLALKRSQVELISGETSAEKRFLVRDMTMENLSERLEAVT